MNDKNLEWVDMTNLLGVEDMIKNVKPRTLLEAGYLVTCHEIKRWFGEMVIVASGDKVF